MGRILVVDDDPDILNITEQVLVAAGHTVFLAQDALTAMDWLNQLQFDMLVSDANMPHYSGFELVGTVRNDDRFENMSVAMLTGLRERKDVEKALKAGVDDYIVKPIDPLILVQKINSLFNKRPPQTHAEIDLRHTKQNQGSIRTAIQVDSVSELGICIVTDLNLQVGQSLDIHCDFFAELETETPPMKVLSVEKIPGTTQVRARLIFLGAQEAFLQKIRRWLYSHGGSNRTLL